MGHIYNVIAPGDWIIANIIGDGIYEIVDLSEYHVNVRVKKLFCKGTYARGHITNCHEGGRKLDIRRWQKYKKVKQENRRSK